MLQPLILPQAEILVPNVLEGVCAGFPSPADDYLDDPIDLGALLVANRPATFLFTVDGWSMRDAGIFHGDILVIDRSLEPRDGDVVVAAVDGERSVKRLHLSGGRPRLAFENAEFPSYRIPELSEVAVFGVVTWTLHRMRGAAGGRR